MLQKKLPFSLKEGHTKIIDNTEFTLVRIINHGILRENDGSPCSGEQPYIETICKDTDGLFYICNKDMHALDKGFSSIEKLAEVHGKSGITELNELQELAIELYNKSVLVPQYREWFLESIKAGVPVFDMRDKGFYCHYCAQFATKEIGFADTDKAIYINAGTITDLPKQIWIVNTHYDGCRGWE